MAYHSKRIGFRIHSVYKFKKPSVAKIARQKLSFLIASMSLFAFVVGNMLGQHGWYAFWKLVLGKEDDSIMFMGTINPIEKVPNYEKWISYGGTPNEHTFRMVPTDLLVPLPPYNPQELRNRKGENLAEAVYSVGHLGSYTTGDDHGGSHAGVDIRVPVGTPVLSIANGIVKKVSMQDHGFGHFVLIRHPNVPDAENPGKTTTLYSTSAHLDAILVSEGQVVHKGQQIATSGKTGEASGPHLHFQIDRGDAPFHPYWTFTTEDMKNAGLSFYSAVNSKIGQPNGTKYTLSPMLFVQAHYSYSPTIAEGRAQETQMKSAAPARARTVSERRLERLKSRTQIAGTARPINTSVVAVGGGVPSIPLISSTKHIADNSTSGVTATPSGGSTTDVDRLVFEHSGTLSPKWQRVNIRAVDKNGATVVSPSFPGKIYVIPEFGEAELRPSELTAANFVQGVATVNLLTRGKKTTILSTRGPFTVSSAPLVYKR